MAELTDFGKAAMVLIALAAIILSGIAIVQQYRDTLKVDTTTINETLTISSQTGSLTYDEVTLSSFILVNASAADQTIITLISGNVSTDPNVNLTESGTVTLVGSKAGYEDGSYKATYTYAADTDGSNAATNFVTGLGIFGAFIGVMVISLVGKAIILLFRKG